MVRACIVLASTAVLTAVLGTAVLVASLVRPGCNAIIVLGRLWSDLLLRVCGIEVRRIGLDRGTSRMPCVFVSNHASVVDIWALLISVPDATRFVAKDALFRVPIFGWALAASGFIPIDRTNRARAMDSLERAAARIREGRPILVFAEGTRSPDGRLLPFKKGAFHLAIAAGVPIVPVTVRGSAARIPARALRVFPGPPVDVVFDEPVETAGLGRGDVDDLVARVRGTIAARLAEGPEARATGDGRQAASG